MCRISFDPHRPYQIPFEQMKTEAHSAAWTSIGWIGSALILLTWVEVAFPGGLPGARRLFGRILPLQVFATLLIGAGLCIAAGVLKKRWFLLPGVAALMSFALFLWTLYSALSWH